MHHPQVHPFVPARQGIAFAVRHRTRLQAQLQPARRALTQAAQSARQGHAFQHQAQRLRRHAVGVLRQPRCGALTHRLGFMQQIVAEFAAESGHGQFALAAQGLQRHFGAVRLQQGLAQLVLRQAIQGKGLVFWRCGLGLGDAHGQALTPIHLDRVAQKSLQSFYIQSGFG